MKYILAFLIILMPGCASTFSGLCGMIPLMESNGVTFAQVQCKAQE